MSSTSTAIYKVRKKMKNIKNYSNVYFIVFIEAEDESVKMKHGVILKMFFQ